MFSNSSTIYVVNYAAYGTDVNNEVWKTNDLGSNWENLGFTKDDLGEDLFCENLEFSPFGLPYI